MPKAILANGTPVQQVSPQTDTQTLAAIYARVSTEDQGKGFSLPTQIEACQALAQQEGYIIPESHVLRDDMSGTTLERPGLRQLREWVTRHAIAAVIVHDPDRLSRTLGHQLLLSEELEQAGVRLLIVSHPLEKGPEQCPSPATQRRLYWPDVLQQISARIRHQGSNQTDQSRPARPQRMADDPRSCPYR